MQKRVRHEHDGMTCSPPAQSTPWTDSLPQSPHVTFFKELDWASTPLGPLQEWSCSLRFATRMLFNDSRGAAVYWGPHYIGLYNEKFIPIISSAHPILMGNSFHVGFPSAWSDMKHVFDTVFEKGECVEFQKMELLLNQGNGYLEETYYVGQFIPLKNDFGKVEGTYNSGYESTAQVLYQRRREQLDRLASAPSTDSSRMMQGIFEALASNPRDVSMALIYSLDEEQQHGKSIVKLECAFGVPNNHVCAPASGVLGETHAGFLPFFEQVQKTMESRVFLSSLGNLESEVGHLLNGIEWQGWGEPCRDLSIVPLQNASTLIGFLVITTNPRRVYDQSSVQYVTDVAQQIAIKWSSAITVEKANQREQRLLDELAETEQRIRHMALCAPVGLVHLTVEGKVDWANDQWYDLTSNPRGSRDPIWLECYTIESQKVAMDQWELLLQGSNTSCELQLHREFTPPIHDDTTHHMWVIALGFPMVVDGKVKYIMGTLTDVSRLKWAESVQARNADEAAKAKRQQEEFIDITSHEMRNPLSAIYQCASMISKSLIDLPHRTQDLLSTLEANIDAANTILVCAQHQRRIVDDVLILNRLETMMLSITPVAVHVPSLIDAVVKMFDAELESARVSLEVIRHASFDEQAIDGVCCDPSRLTQIFINLISNAIKFIRNRPQRTIRIKYGASVNIPSEDQVTMTDHRFYWAPDIASQVDPTTSAAWGDGLPLFLIFSIEDTGPGLDEDEIPRMFARFSQANSRTHITYGGSGLGLYISNALAQRQGGRMGISSSIGVGTNISFYIKCKRLLLDSSMQDPTSLGISPPKVIRARTDPVVTLDHFRSKDKFTNGRNIPQAHKLADAEKSKIRLLLVEDNLINQRILRKQLQKMGCEVHVANHGRDAIDLLNGSSTNWTIGASEMESSKFTIDLVLMDWEMPEMDGLTCTKLIRAVEADRNIPRLPIIGITANARSEQLQSAMDSGMDDIITKPFLVEDLLVKVRNWLDR